jgi:hypothetical protein
MSIVGIVLSIACALIVLPGAKHAQSPVLYIVLFGGLFVGVPLAISIGCLTGYLPVRGERTRRR